MAKMLRCCIRTWAGSTRCPPTGSRSSGWGIAQSMSRKGNCLDNAKAENFFSMVKTELYYDWEGDDPDIFERDLEEYIDWYNNVRIKRRLDGSSPVEYRLSRAA